MKQLTTFALTFLLSALSLADGWILKPPYAAHGKTVWKVSVKATVGGVEHDVRFKRTLAIDSNGDDGAKGKESWTDFLFDGNADPDQDATWDMALKGDGGVASAGQSGDYVKMVSPFFVVYPNKEVKKGDKWTAKLKPSEADKEISVAYEVSDETKLGDVDALIVKATFSGEGPFKASNTYWVSKSGDILRFELNLTSWTVPLAGQSDFDAKVTGEIAK
ncbi:MAG TPA: hypothetical protein VHE55_11705 [Fimbriimonadaceae bacterium]|nr:hypothetical protein [Fimbriimonadaceae bacterium]